jgi:hypothetical protein
MPLNWRLSRYASIWVPAWSPTFAGKPNGWTVAGHVDELGGNYVTINLACLDDIEPAELASAPVTHMDGRNDNWFLPPEEVRHL